MGTIKKFEDLEIWQRARMFYVKISSLCKVLKQEHHEFRFAEQMKSAAGSIMDNIAEGFERGSKFEFTNSLTYSKGENGEVRSQLYRCLDDQYLSKTLFDEYYSDSDILSGKIARLIKYLNSTGIAGPKFKDRRK